RACLDADLDLLAELDRRAEVDLRAGQDQALERVVTKSQGPQEREARGLHVRHEDGVVDVAHAVQIAKTHRFPVHEVEAVHGPDAIDHPMPGEKPRAAMAAQPDWLRLVSTEERFPHGRLLFTGCGTSFHAAQTGGDAVQALQLVLPPERDADLLGAGSPEGGAAV